MRSSRNCDIYSVDMEQDAAFHLPEENAFIGNMEKLLSVWKYYACCACKVRGMYHTNEIIIVFVSYL